MYHRFSTLITNGRYFALIFFYADNKYWNELNMLRLKYGPERDIKARVQFKSLLFKEITESLGF